MKKNGYRSALATALLLWLLLLQPWVPQNGAVAAEEDIGGVSSETLRGRLVEKLVARGISDEKVIAAMRAVPRHEFVPEKYRKYSYDDRPLPIGMDQTISQPFVVAYMTEMLKLEGGEKVLEIGTGSGSQAEVLAEIDDEI